MDIDRDEILAVFQKKIPPGFLRLLCEKASTLSEEELHRSQSESIIIDNKLQPCKQREFAGVRKGLPP